MAERKAVNKYYPPDWDPRKGSANKRVGQHPLRDRAKKLSQGILVIRFELPYNIWCGGCGIHIGMGVRYNAEKSKVGNYYTTPIYKFRMKCHLCDNYFEIQTDPKNHDYVILSGARRKEQRWNPVENEQVVPEDKATQKKLATDAMYKLEHGTDDQQKGKDKVMSLAEIEESRISMLDDYYLNRIARDKFRAEKRQLKELADADRAILERASLSINLVEESEEDRKLAGLMKYSVTSSFEEKQKERRNSIEQRPIFNSGDGFLITDLPVSSPSSINVIPKQSPAATVSQHGDVKQTLGKVLQATYKDPFMFDSKKMAMKASSCTKPDPSKLGIRLKSSAVSKGLSLLKLIKKRTLNKTKEMVNKQNCDQEATITSAASNSKLSTYNRDLESTVNSIAFKSRLLTSDVPDNANDNIVNCKSASLLPIGPLSQLAQIPLMETSTAEAVTFNVDNEINYSNQLKEQANISSSFDQELTNKIIQPRHQHAPEVTKLGALDMKTNDTKTTKTYDADMVTSDTNLNISSSGLQTLQCSYTDSDTESSS